MRNFNVFYLISVICLWELISFLLIFKQVPSALSGILEDASPGRW